MKTTFLALTLLALAGCQTSAQNEGDRIGATLRETSRDGQACADRRHRSPEAIALYGKLPPKTDAPSLEMQSDMSMATLEEAQMVMTYHRDYIVPCRTIYLDGAARVSPSRVAVFTEGFRKLDAVYLALAERKITWGQFNRDVEKIRNEGDAKLLAANADIRRELNAAHASEVSRRQAAMPPIAVCQYIGTTMICH